MKLKKDIDELNARTATITFPRPDPAWERYDADVRAVVAANLNGVENFDWDPYEARWTFEVCHMTDVGGFRGAFTARFILDPKLPLADEIARLTKALDSLRLACAKSS